VAKEEDASAIHAAPAAFSQHKNNTLPIENDLVVRYSAVDIGIGAYTTSLLLFKAFWVQTTPRARSSVG
jgi:hypothetical protein